MPIRIRLRPLSARSSWTSASSSETPSSCATVAGIARSTNGTPSRSATAGPITLPPVPYVAEMVTTRTHCYMPQGRGLRALEQRGCQPAARLQHRRVVAGERLEEADQMHARLVALVTRGAPDDVDQALEGLVDLAGQQLNVGGLGLEGDVRLVFR